MFLPGGLVPGGFGPGGMVPGWWTGTPEPKKPAVRILLECFLVTVCVSLILNENSITLLISYYNVT